MVFHIEIITLNLLYAYDMGGLYFVGPPYESALADIRVLYPSLNVTQNIITNNNYHGCMDWMNVSDDIIAEYYYRHEDRWQRANLTVFLNSVAGNLIAYNLREQMKVMRKGFTSKFWLFKTATDMARRYWPQTCASSSSGTANFIASFFNSCLFST